MPSNAITTCINDLQKLLGVKKIKIFYDGEYYPQKPSEWGHGELSLEQGTPTACSLVNTDTGAMIARWNLEEMPSCCGIAIMSEFFINPRDRKPGAGEKISRVIRLIVKRMNYKILLGTDIVTNTYHQKILKNSNFKSLLKFRNKNSGNRVNISASVL